MTRPDALDVGASIWRAWHGTHHLALAAVGFALLWLWSGPIEVPGRDDVAQTIWPLAPVFVALACLTGARTAHQPQERLTPRGAPLVRTGYLLAVATLVGVVAIASGPYADRHVLVRNSALLCGLSLLAVELLPASIGWTPIVLYPILTWLAGSNGLERTPEPWAVLLQPAASSPARTVAVAVVVAGTLVYVAHPWLADLRRARLRRHTRPVEASRMRVG